MKRRFLVSFLTLLSIISYGQDDGKGIIGGTVKSSDQESLPNVNILVKQTFWGTTSDIEGRYQLRLPEGRYVLRFHMIGYKERQDTIQVVANRQIEHHVILQVEPIEFRGITVEAAQNRRQHLFTSFLVSQRRAKNVPSLGEPDIFKAMATLPGVIQHNDLTGNLHVRGGGADQNLILLDGVEIYNPYHLLGLLGTFNMQAITSAEIFIGDFPAKYGDRLSSIIDLKTLDSPRQTTANLGLLSSGFSLAKEWKKNLVFLAARRTYLDLLVPKLDYHFTDANFKVRLSGLKNLGLEIIGFYDKDHLTPEPESEDKLSANWGNWMAAARVSWCTRLQMTSILISYTRNFVDFTSNPFIDNQIGDLTIRSNTLVSWRNHQIEFGLSNKTIRFDYQWRGDYSDLKEIFHEGTPEQFSYDHTRQLVAAYFSDGITLGKRAKIELGMRYNNWNNAGVWSPRLSSVWHLTPMIEAILSLGRYHQFLAYGRESIEGSVGSLLFPTIVSTDAEVAALGINFNLPYNMRLAVEGYQKLIRRMPRFGPSFPEFELGQGKALGTDFFLTKDEGALTFQITYSFLNSRARFTGERYPFDWDIPHTFNVLAGYEIAKGWFINGTVRFRSGSPITPVKGKFLRVLNGDEQQPYRFTKEEYIEGSRNSARLPDYFRLDVSLRKKFFKRNYNFSLYLQVLNLLNTENTLRYDWQRYYSSYYIDEEGNKKRDGGVSALPIIPSFGAEFEF